MRSRTAVLAAMLAMAPLGARAADLVVWWDEGRNAEEREAVRKIIAAFEQDTGKQVELVFHPEQELPDKITGALGGRPAARLRLRLLTRQLHGTVGPRRPARRSRRRRRPLLGSLRSGRARLDEELTRRDAEARCGLMVVDLRTGDAVHWLRIEGVVEELYDVAVLPGVRRPMAIGLKTDELRRMITVGEPEPLTP